MDTSKSGVDQAETERPRDLNEALKNLREMRVREVGPEADPEARFETALETLPSAIREKLQAELEEERRELIENGMDEEKARGYIARRAEKQANTLRQGFEDQRFAFGDKERLFKDNYAKLEIQDQIDKLLDNDPQIEDLKKIARLAFDANGLKAANDLSGSHEKGDEFLRRIAEVFHNPKGPTRQWLKKQGVGKILATTGGGDEYNVLLTAEKPIDSEVISEAIKRFEKEVTALKVNDLVDFDNEETLFRYGHVSPAEWNRLNPKEKKAQLEKIKAEIPPGAEFKASISGGGATLADGLARAVEGGNKNAIAETDSYRRALEKIMGGLLDVADINANGAKTEFKNNLRQSRDSKDRFLSGLLARTAEARGLEQKIGDQADQIARFKALLKETVGMVEAVGAAGLAPEQLKKMLLEKLRDIG